MRNPMLYVADILTAMSRIQEYTEGVEYDSFFNNQMMVDAVTRNLEIIGEAAGNIPSALQEKYKEIPWKEMKGLRNVLIHEYFGVSTSIIWNIATKDVPKTKDLMMRMFQEEGDSK